MSPGLKQSYKDLVCTHYQTLHKIRFGKLLYQFPIAAITNLAAENDSVLSSELSGGHMSKICFYSSELLTEFPSLKMWAQGPASLLLSVRAISSF